MSRHLLRATVMQLTVSIIWVTIMGTFTTTEKMPVTSLGLSEREAESYSLVKAIRSLLDDKGGAVNSFERDCSVAISQRLGKPADTTRSFYVPFEVQTRSIRGPGATQYRDVYAGTTGSGGYLVQTSNVGFVDLLRNRSVMLRMGTQKLSGLQGNIAIPREGAGATGYWLTNETTQATETQQTFTQISMSPKTVAGYVEISRQLLLQSSPGAEGIVSADLAKQIATAADLACINGSGSNGQPQGIIGMGSVNTLSGTTLSYSGLLSCQTNAAASNSVLIAPGYVTTPTAAALLMARVKFANTPAALWDGAVNDATCCGYHGMSSNQVPSGYMLFGDFNECVLAEWNILEIMVNPFANFSAGIVGVRAMYSVDFAVKHPSVFTVVSGIT